MLKLLIGNKAYSSWSLRGWLACQQSGLPFATQVFALYDDAWRSLRETPDFAPSAGKVPILWNGDHAVWESLAIIDYLDEISGGDRFWPTDRAARGLARSIAAEMHSGFVALRREHPCNVRRRYAAADPSPEVAADIDRLCALWATARQRFAGDGAYLFGDFGAADIMFAPVVTRLVTYDLPVPAPAQDYIESIMAHPWMCEWIAAAHAEPWVIDRFERSA